MSGTGTLRGSQTPRIELVPEGDEHPDLFAALQLVREAGIELDEWQERIFRASLLRRDGRWAAFAVAVCCPRQNGKNALLEAVELSALFVLGERMIVHSAHQADTSKEAFRRLDELLESRSWLSSRVRHVWRTNGHEAIELDTGGRIRFRTRTMKGGRGFSGNRVIFDEAMYLAESAMGSMLPVISAQPDPQIWYTGSAVDQYVHEDGVVFARARERAIAGDDGRLAYFEWSVDAATPDQLDERVAADPAAWAAANPALASRIGLDYVEAERRELDARTFAVERLGVGDWPPTSLSAAPVIDLDRWDALADTAFRSEGLTPCLAFDVAPDQEWASISAAVRRPDGLPMLEIAKRALGTRWLIPELVRIVAAHQPFAVMCGGSSPAEAFVAQLQEEGVFVEVLPAADHAKACGLLTSLVNSDGIRHAGQPEVRAALKGAARRPYSDSWLWSRRKSSVDISPLVAETLALWGLQTLGWDGDLVIY